MRGFTEIRGTGGDSELLDNTVFCNTGTVLSRHLPHSGTDRRRGNRITVWFSVFLYQIMYSRCGQINWIGVKWEVAQEVK